MATPLGTGYTPLATASEQLRASNGSSALAAAIAAAEAKTCRRRRPCPRWPRGRRRGAAGYGAERGDDHPGSRGAARGVDAERAPAARQAAPRPPVTAPTLPSLGAAAAKAPVTLARRVQPAPVAKDSDDDDDLDIQASTKSLKDAPVEPPPPPGSGSRCASATVWIMAAPCKNC